MATEKLTNYTRRHKCQVYHEKRNCLTLVDMFSKIKKSVKTETKEYIKLHLFYCKKSTLF